MELTIQLAINALSLGAIYSLLSLGFAVIYNTVRIFHVLHGAAFVISGYVFWAAGMEWGFPVYIAGSLAVVAAGASGLLMEYGVYRRFRGRGAGFLTSFLGSLSALFFFESLLLVIFRTTIRIPRQPGPLETFNIRSESLGLDLFILQHSITTIVLVALIVVGVTLFFRFTQWGRMIRAVASNPELAVAVGINAPNVYIMVFVLGSALAGVGGVMQSFEVGVTPVVGIQLAITAVAGVIIGGIGSMPGAVVGALALGVAQTLASYFLGGNWAEPAGFVLLLLVVVFRPYGLLGTREHRELRRLL